MYIKTKTFHHFQWLTEAVSKLGGESFVNVATLRAELRFENKVYVLHPMFTIMNNGKRAYTYQFQPDATSFVGWKPYVDRATPEFGKKLTFKKFIESNGLKTPAYSIDNNTKLKNIIVKRDISSFGDQIHGPFINCNSYNLNVGSGEFFETFTLGDIVKIWYWNEKPIVMESQDMPIITGDGVSTVKQLVMNSYHMRAKESKIKDKINWKEVETLLNFQDLKLDTILEADRSILVDFRYISEFTMQESVKTTRFTTVEPQYNALFKLGIAMHNELTSNAQINTLYSIDGIRDKDGKFWFLEANFNPTIHPCQYVDMITSLRNTTEYRELRQVAPVSS